MKYTVDDLILDLNNRTNWTLIQKKYNEAGLDIKQFSKEEAEKFRKAFNKYTNAKYFDELPPIHIEVPRKK